MDIETASTRRLATAVSIFARRSSATICAPPPHLFAAALNRFFHNMLNPIRSPRLPTRRQSSADLVLIALAVVVCFVTASWLDLSEKLGTFFKVHEALQLDEWLLSLLVLTVGLCWFALKRNAETQNALCQHIAAEKKVAVLLRHNRDLSQALIRVQENERRALARDLHDDFGQSCTAIRTDANYILHAYVNDAAGVLASAKRIDHAAQTLHALCRTMLDRLRPPVLDSLGLQAAVQELCETWEEQTGVACYFFPQALSVDIDDEVAVTCYRLVQEALTNVTRHASAHKVRIDLSANVDRSNVKLRIEDDGCGMAAPEESVVGLGLLGMRERVAVLHGDIAFKSAPGSGLRIDITLPLARQHA
jgi:signal transduction histidine kinase